MTLEELMETVGCTKYPERWSEIFDSAMEEYDRQGCFLADPAYYESMHEKFGCFDIYMDAYKQAAIQVASDEMLGRFLTLLVMALRKEETRQEDIKNFERLQPPSDKPRLGYDMVTGLALCAQLNDAVEVFEKKAYPHEVICGVLRMAVNGVSNYERTHNGEWGFDLLDWAQRYVEGRLFPIERLEIELNSNFAGKAIVFQNEEGDTIALAKDIVLHRQGMALGSLYYEDEKDSWVADVTETEEEYIGYPYKENGFVSTEQIVLEKDKWNIILQTGDPVVRLHIPRDGKLTPESVDTTLEKTKEFLKSYHSDYQYKAFACKSWLIDPQLKKLLNEKSNIVHFCNRFQAVTMKSGGEGVLYFVFSKQKEDCVLTDLPENTSLERILKRHYLDGGAIYEMEGFFQD